MPHYRSRALLVKRGVPPAGTDRRLPLGEGSSPERGEPLASPEAGSEEPNVIEKESVTAPEDPRDPPRGG